jgi:hypothetical protein
MLLSRKSSETCSNVSGVTKHYPRSFRLADDGPQRNERPFKSFQILRF